MDIVSGDFCRQFRLLIKSSDIGQCVSMHGQGMGWGIIILANWKNHFIRVRRNLVKYPSNSQSIKKKCVFSYFHSSFSPISRALTLRGLFSNPAGQSPNQI